MTPEEFNTLIEEYSLETGGSNRDIWYTDWDLAEPFYLYEATLKVEWKEVQNGGEDVFVGGEGEIYVVLKVSHFQGDVQFFKKSGIYSSYSGHVWNDGLTEVVPVEKTIIVYEEKQ